MQVKIFPVVPQLGKPALHGFVFECVPHNDQCTIVFITILMKNKVSVRNVSCEKHTLKVFFKRGCRDFY